MPTALEIAQGRNVPLSSALFMAVQTRTPLLSRFDARTTAGYNFLSLALISLPSSAFARYGEGFSASNARFALREFSPSLIGGIIMAEKITMERWDREHPTLEGGGWFGIQTEAKFIADMQNLERQLIKGLSNDANGFPGAKEMTPYSTSNAFLMTASASDYNYQRTVLNVAGSTAGTASSIYSFIFGETEAQLVICGVDGDSGELIRMGERTLQKIAPDPVNYPAKISEHWLAQMDGHMGLSVSGHNNQVAGQTVPTQYSVRRACNVTAQTGYTCTDKVLDKLTRSHGVGKRPNLIAMSERSGEQLAASRTPAVQFMMGSGDAAAMQSNIYPDPPENWRGIPIVYPGPDVIGNTDAIEA